MACAQNKKKKKHASAPLFAFAWPPSWAATLHPSPALPASVLRVAPSRCQQRGSGAVRRRLAGSISGVGWGREKWSLGVPTHSDASALPSLTPRLPSPLLLRSSQSAERDVRRRKSPRREAQKAKAMSCLSPLPSSLLTAPAIQAEQPSLSFSLPPPASTSPLFFPPPLLLLLLGCPSCSGY